MLVDGTHRETLHLGLGSSWELGPADIGHELSAISVTRAHVEAIS